MLCNLSWFMSDLFSQHFTTENRAFCCVKCLFTWQIPQNHTWKSELHHSGPHLEVAGHHQPWSSSVPSRWLRRFIVVGYNGDLAATGCVIFPSGPFVDGLVLKLPLVMLFNASLCYRDFEIHQSHTKLPSKSSQPCRFWGFRSLDAVLPVPDQISTCSWRKTKKWLPSSKSMQHDATCNSLLILHRDEILQRCQLALQPEGQLWVCPVVLNRFFTAKMLLSNPVGIGGTSWNRAVQLRGISKVNTQLSGLYAASRHHHRGACRWQNMLQGGKTYRRYLEPLCVWSQETHKISQRQNI